MANRGRLPLHFPYALAIEGANIKQRRLIMLAHLCLILNSIFLLFELPPVGGIVAAFGVLMIAKSQADAAGIPAVNHGLMRCVTGALIVLTAWGWSSLLQDVLPAPRAAWLLVPLLQISLGIADAQNVWRGGNGWRMVGLQRF